VVQHHAVGFAADAASPVAAERRARRHESQLFLCHSGESAMTVALPLQPAQFGNAGPLLNLEKIDAVGLWDGCRFTLCWAQTQLGRWVNA
jgi:hypothetical protein